MSTHVEPGTADDHIIEVHIFHDFADTTCNYQVWSIDRATRDDIRLFTQQEAFDPLQAREEHGEIKHLNEDEGIIGQTHQEIVDDCLKRWEAMRLFIEFQINM